MHEVKLGNQKGVRDPLGHAWVRTSIRGDVLHRQIAGCPCPLLPIEISAMLKMLMQGANLKVHSHGHKVFALTLGEILQSDGLTMSNQETRFASLSGKGRSSQLTRRVALSCAVACW